VADVDPVLVEGIESEDGAEKAYAAATETVVVAPAPVEMAEAAPAPVSAAPVKKAAPAKVVTAKARKPKVAAPAVAKVVAKPAKPVVAKKITAKSKAVKVKVLAPKQTKPVTHSTISQLKEKIMAKASTTDFTAGIQTVVADVQEKAKAAFEKSTASLGEVTEFAKGNVEAVVESGKIFAAGLQDLSTGYVAEGKSAFEKMTADVKELAAVKSPADFFKLQGELLRSSFDAAMAAGSKNSEAFMKLANEAVAPISGRVSLAIDKVKKAA
jgi:hypothetical protein